MPLARRAVPALALLLLTTSPATAQRPLFPDRRVEPRFDRLNHSFFVNARYFVRQTGYEDLWRRYDGHLPTGKGVVVAQVENGLADPAAFPGVEVVHAPGLANPVWERHAGTVGQILYGPEPHRDKDCAFDRGFAPGVRTVFAYTSNDFRKHVLKIETRNTRGPALPAWPDPARPVDVLNVSNTLGNGGEDQVIRALDHLIDATDVLACASQPGSLKSNASLAGNLWNAVVVGKTSPDFGYAEGTDYENVGGRRRPKPDLVACSSMSQDGGASSWSTPVVASAAAMLIERARATPNTKRAERNVVLKAILLAGASTEGLLSPVYDDAGRLTGVDREKPWAWARTPEAPLDRLFGAGALHVANSYRILEAGEAPRAGGPAGWGLGEGLTRDEPREVRIDLKEPTKGFAAALVWNRHVQTPEGKPYTFTVADLRLELRDAAGAVVQWSDDPGNNVEFLRLDKPLPAGCYTLRVVSHTEAAETFGLAWHGRP